MGRKAKERRKAARGFMSDRSVKVNNGEPIVGDMATRMVTISKGETQTADQRRLPMHYQPPANNAHYDTGASYGSHGTGAYIDGQRQDGWIPGRSNRWDNTKQKWVQGDWINGVWVEDGGAVHTSGYLSEPSMPVIDAGFRRMPAEDETTFRCESEDITSECPIAKTPEVYIPSIMWNELCKLVKDCDTEWLAYLCGSYDAEKRRFDIKQLYFPPQTATGAHVDVDEDFEPKAGTIGAIHSHVNMAVFFSAEDIAHSNWAVEIVVNSREEYKAMVRHKLECGKFAKAYTKVYLVGPAAAAVYSTALDKAFKVGGDLDERRRRKERRVSGFVPINEHQSNGNPELNRGSIIPSVSVTVGPAAAEPITVGDGMAIDPVSGAVKDASDTWQQQRRDDADKEALIDGMAADEPVDEIEGEICARCSGMGWISEGGVAETCPNCDGSGLMISRVRPSDLGTPLN